MKMADFWIIEKQYIHKLFKVLAPRFENYNVSCTRMYKAPQMYPNVNNYQRAVLELRGNPYPPLKPTQSNNQRFIQNVLLEEARKEYRRAKYAEVAEKLAPLSKGKEADANASGSDSIQFGEGEKLDTQDEQVGKSPENTSSAGEKGDDSSKKSKDQ